MLPARAMDTVTPEAEAAQVARASGSSFYFPMRFLSAPRRRALHALYAFCRAADDAVDEAENEADAIARLAEWRRELDAAFAGNARTPLMRALQAGIHAYALPRAPFDDMLEGFQSDCRPRVHMPDWDALDTYCYRVAGCPGLLALPIFGAHAPESAAFARALGLALQLTNIRRDFYEDYAQGRLYLPETLLREHGVAPDAPTDDPAWHAPLKALIARAEAAFARCIPPAADRRALLPALLMRDGYRLLLARLKSAPHVRPALGRTDKARLLLYALGYTLGIHRK